MFRFGFIFCLLLPWKLTLTTTGQQISQLAQDLQREKAHRIKLIQDVKNLQSEIDELRNVQGPSTVNEEIALINEDIEKLNKGLKQINITVQKDSKPIGGNGGVGNININDITRLQQAITKNSEKVTGLKSEVTQALSDVRKDLKNATRDLEALLNEQTLVKKNVTKITKQSEKQWKVLRQEQDRIQKKQSNIDTELNSIRIEQRNISNELAEMKKSLNDMQKLQNNQIITSNDFKNRQNGISKNQTKIRSKQRELAAEQKKLNKQHTYMISKLSKLSGRHTELETSLSNISSAYDLIRDDNYLVKEMYGDINKTQLEMVYQNLSELQKNCRKGLGDLKMEIYNSACCIGKGGAANNNARLKGRMYFALANEVKTTPKWKDSNGKKFMVVLPSTYRKYERDLTIMLSAKQGGWYYVDNPYLGIEINNSMSSGNIVYTVVNDIHVTPLKVERNSFWIETSDASNLFLMSTRSRSSDGFNVFPYNSLAKEYVISTTEPYGSYQSYKSHHRSFISVGATHDATRVHFKLNMVGYITYKSRRYYTGHTLTVNLNQYETFELQHCYDLSGTLVTSSYPIAVLSGNQCNKLGRGSCSQLVDMIPPVRSLSANYIIPLIPDRTGSIINIVATTNKTSIRIHRYTIHKGNGNTSYTTNPTLSKTINAEQNYETAIDNNTLIAIRGSNPLLVSQSINGTVKSDPMMLVIPGKKQFQSSYQFSVPAFNFHSWISVVVETQDLSGLRLDGKVLSLSTTEISQMTVEGTQWTLFAININSSSHTMTQTSKRPFGMIIYGNRHRDGYAFPAGVKLLSG